MASPLKKLLKKIELSEDQKTDPWSNEDIRPVPPERQTWRPLQYVELWLLVYMNLSTYETGASLLSSGLSLPQSIIVIVIGNLLAASFAVLNSVSGAASHMGYPIVSRSVWGMYGAYFPILNRILLSVVWYGVQAVFGGKMIYICLRAIWMDLDNRIPNHLPAGIGITSAQFVGYFLFNVLCCFMIWFKPTQLRPYFHVGTILVGIAMFSLLGWAVGTTKGYGDVWHPTTKLSSSELGWTMCSGMMSVIGSIAAGILNQNDYTRFARKVEYVTWSQAISFSLSSCVVAIIGIFVTAATQEEYGNGTALWDLTELLTAIQNAGGSRARAATFFLGCAFIISQLSINVVGNVLAGGLDVASVFPKYVNLRRGAYILAALSVLPNPWQQIANGSTFLSVLSAYAVFLGPMTGLLCVHYWIIQKRRFHVPDLYEGSKLSLYWYNYGVNWRTAVVWVCSCLPSMPGFVNDVNPSLKVSQGGIHVFNLSYVFGFAVSVVMSIILHTVFPVDFESTTVLEQREMEIAGVDPDAPSDDGVEQYGVGSKQIMQDAEVTEVKDF